MTHKRMFVWLRVLVFLMSSLGFAGQEKATSKSSSQKPAAPQASPTPTPVQYSLEPKVLQLGEEHEVVFRSNPASDVSKLKVEPLAGKEVQVHGSPTPSDNGQSLILKLRVNPGATLGPVTFKITDGDKITTANLLNITAIEPIPQGPTPGGVTMVDAAWLVQSNEVVRGNFGRHVANHFYAIRVMLGNNSGYDLEVAQVLFEGFLRAPTDKGCEKGSGTKLPASDFRAVRGMLEEGQEVGPRNTVVKAIAGVGGVMTGLIPFYHQANPKANFTTFANLVNGAFQSGLSTVVPDQTIRQLARLGDQGLQNSIIINNNHSIAFTVFVPKQVFEILEVAPPTGAKKRPKYGMPPWEAMERLGNLVLVGNEIKLFQQREIVIARQPAQTSTSAQQNQDLMRQLIDEELKKQAPAATPIPTPPVTDKPAAKPKDDQPGAPAKPESAKPKGK
jgi:hypothetical protein